MLYIKLILDCDNRIYKITFVSSMKGVKLLGQNTNFKYITHMKDFR